MKKLDPKTQKLLDDAMNEYARRLGVSVQAIVYEHIVEALLRGESKPFNILQEALRKIEEDKKCTS